MVSNIVTQLAIMISGSIILVRKYLQMKSHLCTFHEEQPMLPQEIERKYFQLAYFLYNILSPAKIKSMQSPLRLLEQERR